VLNERNIENSFTYLYKDELRKKVVTTISEYNGEEELTISCTQLDSTTQKDRKQILTEWIDFLSSNRTAFTILSFPKRVPQELFNALCMQKRLRSLDIKWGQYPDISAIENLSELRLLNLGSGSSIQSIEPIAKLKKLEGLHIENYQCINDYSPLITLNELVSLEIYGDIWAPKNIHIKDLEFLRHMPQLRRFELCRAIIENNDYSPLSALENIEALYVYPRKKNKNQVSEILKALPKLKYFSKIFDE